MIKEAKVMMVECDRCSSCLKTQQGQEYFPAFSLAESEASRARWAKISTRWYCPGCYTQTESGNPVVKPSNH